MRIRRNTDPNQKEEDDEGESVFIRDLRHE